MTAPLTVPALFALSQGSRCAGPETCAFCGSPCGREHATKPFKDKIKVTSIHVHSTAQAESTVCCAGCFASFREKVTIYHPPIPPDTKPTHQDSASVREFSWFITPEQALAYDCTNPTYRKLMRERLLNPPKPPWAAVLTTSRSDVLFWRGEVNAVPEPPHCVLVDTAVVEYAPDELRKRLDLVGRIKAVVHTCATIDEFHDAFVSRYNDAAALLDQWRQVKGEGMSRLADFLAWEPEECAGKFPPEPRPAPKPEKKPEPKLEPEKVEKK